MTHKRIHNFNTTDDDHLHILWYKHDCINIKVVLAVPAAPGTLILLLGN